MMRLGPLSERVERYGAEYRGPIAAWTKVCRERTGAVLTVCRQWNVESDPDARRHGYSISRLLCVNFQLLMTTTGFFLCKGFPRIVRFVL